MSAEWLTAAGTVGTFVVITASAIAALMQLRHTRGSNQIVALTEIRETLESPEFRQAQRFVSYELPKRLLDPLECRKIVQLPFAGEYEAIGMVSNFFENVGVFVKNRIIDASLACDLWAYVVLRNWRALLPVTTYIRETLAIPALWENFEYIAALSQAYTDAHPSSYPEHMGRLPEDRSLIDRVALADDQIPAYHS